MKLETPTPVQASEAGMLSNRLRWGILALLSLSITINLIDRQVLSVVAPLLRDQLHLSNTDYAYIVFAFQLGMFLGQIPAGIVLDRIGTRIGMALIFASWSVFNGLHSLARSMNELLGLRFAMGLSECGNYSGGIKAIAHLFPAEGRALAGGMFNAGAQLGSVIAPPFIVLITVHFGWPAAFLLPSLLGSLWIFPWLRYFPRVRSSKADLVVSVPATCRLPLTALLRNRQVIGLFLLRVFTGPLTSFFWYWLPEYLRHARGMSFVLIGLMAWIPYLFGTFGNIGGGFASDWLIRRGHSMDQARKISFVIGAVLSAMSVVLPFTRGNFLAIGVLCLIVFGSQWTAATYIATVGDIFPSAVVGRVNGIAGAGDSGAGMIAMLVTGIIIDHYSYYPVLLAAGILPLVALIPVFGVIRRIEPVSIAGAGTEP